MTHFTEALPERKLGTGLTVPAHCVAGGGGGPQGMFAVGALCALKVSGLPFATIGGVSAGATAAAVVATYYPSTAFEVARRIDLSSLVRYHFVGLWKGPGRYFVKADELETLLNQLVPQWPDRYWCMAQAENKQIVFRRDGVFQVTPDGAIQRIADEPPSVGFAIKASSAIPHVFPPVEYRDLKLTDGAYTSEGALPLLLVQRLFQQGDNSDNVIGIKLPPRKLDKWVEGKVTGKANPFCQPYSEEALVISEKVNLSSMRLKFSPEKKLKVLATGWHAAIKAVSVKHRLPRRVKSELARFEREMGIA